MPEQTRAEDTQAQTAYDKGEFETAARLFESLAQDSTARGDNFKAAEHMNNASVAWLKAGSPEWAWRACEGTDLVFANVGDSRRQAIALGNQAAALDARGNLVEAERRYTASIEAFKTCGDTDMLSYAYKSLSALQVRMGRQLEAVASMNNALSLQKKKSLKERLLQKLLHAPFRLMK